MAQFTIKIDDDFEVFNVQDEFKDEGGVYIFCKEVNSVYSKEYLPLYVGQSKSLKERLGKDHHKLQKARNLGMTHILIDYEQDKQERELLEGFYIGFYDPQLND